MPLILIFGVAIPTLVPWYFWAESLSTSFFVAVIARHIWGLNMTWLVNSAGHLWGHHPYDKWVSHTRLHLITINLILVRYFKIEKNKQKHQSGWKCGRFFLGIWWRMAQLPSRLSLRLQDFRIGQLRTQSDDSFYWFLCLARLGLRFKNCFKEGRVRSSTSNGWRNSSH